MLERVLLGLTRGSFRWADGLTWDMIDRDVTLPRKTPSKTEAHTDEVLEFDLMGVPEVRERLLAVPAEKRVGPVIADAEGVPFDRLRWSQKFRTYREAAEVPADIRMMDTRTGAINHTKRAGASPLQLQHQANHLQQATTDRYIRERSASIDTVIEMRLGNPKAK